jgi:hypothetical protein
VIEIEMTAALRQDETMVSRWLMTFLRAGWDADEVAALLYFCSDAASSLTG